MSLPDDPYTAVQRSYKVPHSMGMALCVWRSDAIVVQVRHTKLLGLGALVHAGYIGINCTCVLLRLDSCVAEYFLSTLAGPCIDSEYPGLPCLSLSFSALISPFLPLHIPFLFGSAPPSCSTSSPRF